MWVVGEILWNADITTEEVRTCWPYADGYGTVFYLRGKRTIVDTGLTKAEAKRIVKQENRLFR